jgi:hypothetical protein
MAREAGGVKEGEKVRRPESEKVETSRTGSALIYSELVEAVGVSRFRRGTVPVVGSVSRSPPTSLKRRRQS